MDLLPGASLELRVYVILGVIGVMFFASILALGVGRLSAMRNSSNLGELTEPNSPFGAFSEKEPKPVKVKKEKPAKAPKIVKPAKVKKVTDILSDSEEVEFQVNEIVEVKESKPRKPLFGKKKKNDAVQMLSTPSGYVEEYAPVHTRDVKSKGLPELVEYNATSEYSSKPAGNLSASGEVKPQELVVEDFAIEESDFVKPESEAGEWSTELTNSSELSNEESEKKTKKDSNSPFGGADEWEF